MRVMSDWGLNYKGELTLPLMGVRVAAGFPSPATDYMQEPINLNEELIRHPSATFMVRVEGDSMVDVFIPNNALLIVDRSLNVKNNDIVLASIDGEFTVKSYVVNGKGTFLYPANSKYKPIAITAEMNFVVFGVVTFIIVDVKDVKV